MKQEGGKFKVISGYIVTLIVAWDTGDLVVNKTKQNKTFFLFCTSQKISSANGEVRGHFLELASLQPLGFLVPVDTSGALVAEGISKLSFLGNLPFPVGHRK